MMRVLYLTQEYAPAFTEGGLGLTALALPSALQTEQDVHHSIVLPFYPWLVAERGCRTEPVAGLPPVTVAGVSAAATVHRLLDHAGPCEVYLIRSDPWYDRPGIYRDARYVEYADAVPRAAFFGACVAEWVHRSGERFDLVHGNDWQSGAALAHLRHAPDATPVPILANIHSGLYLGPIGTAELDGLGLPEPARAALAETERPNLLLAGLHAADAAVTCSPAYARELGEVFAGQPIGECLRRIGLSAIIPGVDRGVWAPEAAGRSSRPYDATTVETGKLANKRALQHDLGLRAADDVPVFGVCSRMVHEKGTDLLLAAFADLVAAGSAQLVLAGPAEPPLSGELQAFAAGCPDSVYYHPRFEQSLAWQIYAGADFTVMPSRAEPCGLNQLIAMTYGTIPVVTAVGGLRDTVTDLRTGRDGTGFHAADVTAEAFAATVRAAIDWWHNDPAQVDAVRRRGMLADWSWSRTAEQYARLYRDTVTRYHDRVTAHRDQATLATAVRAGSGHAS